jgi:hypothetical protein
MPVARAALSAGALVSGLHARRALGGDTLKTFVNILPEDRAAGMSGSDAWFHRKNPFAQAEIRRQVAYRRARWPELPDGIWTGAASSGRRASRHDAVIRTYPHILPKEHWNLAIFPEMLDEWREYARCQEIAVHDERANLCSSQIACFNFVFPLRSCLSDARRFFAPLLPCATEITSIDFEETGGPDTTAWLGEPPDGSRGAYRTSADVAISWLDRERVRLTYVEWKFTEPEFGNCGGYRSEYNRATDRCDAFDGVRSPSTDCYVCTGRSAACSRRYWEHLGAESSPVALSALEASGCPFRGPLWQLMRLELLAEHARRSTPGVVVDVGVVRWNGNANLLRIEDGAPVLDVWRSALRAPDRIRSATVESLLASLGGPTERLVPWRCFISERYGV